MLFSNVATNCLKKKKKEIFFRYTEKDILVLYHGNDLEYFYSDNYD